MSRRLPTALARLSPDDLLVLLAVARRGNYSAAAEELGLNHTTVARRIAGLEKDLGQHLLVRGQNTWELTAAGERAVEAARVVDSAVRSLGDEREDGVSGVVRLSATDGFSAYVAAPAVAALRRHSPGVAVEIVTATRRAAPSRVGLDIEVVVGRPEVHRAHATRLGPYRLGLYACRPWLAAHGTPGTIADLHGLPLVYFVDSMLQVDSLDAARWIVPEMRDALTSTNVFVHVEATRAGAGVGLLPCFMADRHDDLVRLLPDLVDEQLEYWAVTRDSGLRQPAVVAVLRALRAEVAARSAQLLGAAR